MSVCLSVCVSGVGTAVNKSWRPRNLLRPPIPTPRSPCYVDPRKSTVVSVSMRVECWLLMLYRSSVAISVLVLLLDIRKHAASHIIRRPIPNCFDLLCNVCSTTKSTTTKKWSLGLTLKLISVVADRHRLTNLTLNADEVYQPLCF